MANKYYAIKVGRKTGIFNTWNECKKYVEGYPNSVYKSFGSITEAEDFINGRDTLQCKEIMGIS